MKTRILLILLLSIFISCNKIECRRIGCWWFVYGNEYYEVCSGDNKHSVFKEELYDISNWRSELIWQNHGGCLLEHRINNRVQFKLWTKKLGNDVIEGMDSLNNKLLLHKIDHLFCSKREDLDYNYYQAYLEKFHFRMMMNKYGATLEDLGIDSIE